MKKYKNIFIKLICLVTLSLFLSPSNGVIVKSRPSEKLMHSLKMLEHHIDTLYELETYITVIDTVKQENNEQEY